MTKENLFFAVKGEDNLYYCGAGNRGAGLWDKQLRKAKIYTSLKKAEEIRNDERFAPHAPYIVSVDVVDQGPYQLVRG